MTIRNITPKDLPILAELTNDESLATHTDICYEHSMITLDGDVIIASVILKHSSLSSFFNGTIPEDLSVCKDDNEYEKGDEMHLKESCSAFPEQMQYEIIHTYLKQGADYITLYNTYYKARSDNNGFPIGVIWLEKQNDNPLYLEFYDFNQTIWVDIPRLD